MVGKITHVSRRGVASIDSSNDLSRSGHGQVSPPSVGEFFSFCFSGGWRSFHALQLFGRRHQGGVGTHAPRSPDTSTRRTPDHEWYTLYNGVFY